MGSDLSVDWKEVVSSYTKEDVRVYVTTPFSGLGTPEIALKQILGSLRENFGQDLTIQMHSATDIDPTCSSILGTHIGECAPEHIFEDVLDRIPPEHLRCLQKSQESHKQRFHEFIATNNITGKLERSSLLKSAGIAFMTDVSRILSEVPMTRDGKVFCKKHQKPCPFCPPEGFLKDRNGTLGRTFWLDVAGVICTPWSMQGIQMGWLDEHSLPTIVYCHMLSKCKVDCALIECVPRLDTTRVLGLLGPGFEMEPVTFCTTELGLPVHRRRVYIKVMNMKSCTKVSAFLT
jgi:hypothetical protein